MVVELTKENFDEEILQASGKVFVDYFSEACEPCMALLPFVHNCAEEYHGKLKFASLNIAKARRCAISQQILGIPVMAIYENGTKIEELVKDDATEANIVAMIKRHI